MFVFILKSFLLLLVTLVIIFALFYNFAPVFGGTSDVATLQRMTQADYYHDGKFDNIEPVIVDGSGTGVREEDRLSKMDFFNNIFNPYDGKHPKEPLPTLPLHNNIPTHDKELTWLGHSTVLMRLGKQTLITDPVFYRVSPLPIGGQPYAMTHPPTTSELPAIDVVLISHDHYDHLDMKAISDIHAQVGKFVVPLGVKAHLLRWGVDEHKIFEFGWHDSMRIGELDFTFVPARHYGGRTFGARSKTLWGGWVITHGDYHLYYTGDSGYGRHFGEIAKRYAPDGFDMMLVENGQYNINWADIHMNPEQSVQAAVDAGAKIVLPIHWGKYDLAMHSWREPIERFSKQASTKGVVYLTPKIGQKINITSPTDNPQTSNWWSAVR